jgi:hypothetical protein
MPREIPPYNDLFRLLISATWQGEIDKIVIIGTAYRPRGSPWQNPLSK